MPEKEEKVVNVEVDAVANPKCFTTIPNSTAEFCIYTYKADHESYQQVTKKGFFNSGWSFLNPGDFIRLFRFERMGKLLNYFEFVVVDVDKVLKTVTVAALAQHNLENKKV